MDRVSEAVFDQHVDSDRRFEHVASRAPCEKEINLDVIMQPENQVNVSDAAGLGWQREAEGDKALIG